MSRDCRVVISTIVSLDPWNTTNLSTQNAWQFSTIQPHKQDNESRFPLFVSSSFFPTHRLSYPCSSLVIDFASKAIVGEVFLGHFGHQDCLLCSRCKPTDLCVEITFRIVFCFSLVRVALVKLIFYLDNFTSFLTVGASLKQRKVGKARGVEVETYNIHHKHAKNLLSPS